jgi:hypothetical protein
MNRFLACLCLGLLLSACRARDATVQGSLVDGSDVSRVWVVGITDPTRVVDGEFRLEGLPAGPIDLRFGDDERELGRLLIADVPAGATLRLHRVWIDDRGYAFPSRIEGRDLLVINQLRWAPDGAMGGEVDGTMQVLAAARDGDAVIVRPVDSEGPDLRVVITGATLARTTDGDPVDRLRLRFGDTIDVRGQGQGGFVMAREIVVARAVARRRR